MIPELILVGCTPATDNDSDNPEAATAAPAEARRSRVSALIMALAALPEGGDAGVRMATVNALREEAGGFLSMLTTAAHAKELSSTDEARRAALRAQQLALAVHQAGKVLAMDLSREAGRFLNRRPAIEALSFALATGWEVLCTFTRTYTPLPKNFWLDCHRLFAYIDAQGWAGRTAGRREDSLGTLYRRIMLLGMTGANRLEHAKIELLIGVVRDEAHRIALARVDQPLDEGGAFVFRPDADQPPRFVDALPATDRPVVWWRADLERITQELPKRISALQAAEVASAYELQLLGLLLREWASPPRRRHFRKYQREQIEVEVISQFGACWRALHDSAELPPVEDWGVAIEDDEDAAAHGEVPPPALLQVRNMSSSGLLLEGESPTQPLRTGGLILFRRPGRAWMLGLIRWVSFSGESLASQCGVEILGRVPQAALVMPVISHPGGARYMRALSLKRGRTLVLPGRFYQPFREFLVADGRRLVGARATALVMQAAQYQVFNVKLGAEVAATAELAAEAGQGAQDAARQGLRATG